MLRRPEGRLRGSGWLGHSAALHSHASLHPHFCKPWKPAVSFIGLAKTSYTAETLYAMLPALAATFFVSKINTKKKERENYLKNLWLVETYETYRVTYSIRAYKIFL
jgi:hypothetical protein